MVKIAENTVENIQLRSRLPAHWKAGMDVSTASDTELLANWLNEQNESAFHALVARYAGLVHMAVKHVTAVIQGKNLHRE